MKKESFRNPDQIKLIVCDMDGTLVDSEEKLPDEIFELIELLSERGVKFAIATGRQYWNIRELFMPVIDKIAICAENGGIVFDSEKFVGAIEMDKDRLKRLVDASREITPLRSWPILSAVEKAYIDNPDPEFVGSVTKYFRRFELVGDLNDILDKKIVKLSFYDSIWGEHNSFPYIKHFQDELYVKLASKHWIDLNEFICDKGRAVNMLQDSLRVSPEETMVFGDYLNDLEMMNVAKFSYAMENGHPDLIKAAHFLAPSNDDNGVVRVIKERFCIQD